MPNLIDRFIDWLHERGLKFEISLLITVLLLFVATMILMWKAPSSSGELRFKAWCATPLKDAKVEDVLEIVLFYFFFRYLMPKK
jgi:hypothetical protein